MSQIEIQETEQAIFELVKKLGTLRKNNVREEIKNYTFQDLEGETSLINLFGNKKRLLAIHNMGQACRYCTLWGDGINSFLPHLEDQCAVVLLSKDEPALQRKFANSRNWRFHTASHQGGSYIQEQSIDTGGKNTPGIVCYEREGDKIYRKNSSVFGPGDLFCAHWHLISLAGLGLEEWTPQYNYWSRPSKMDDGGENLLD